MILFLFYLSPVYIDILSMYGQFFRSVCFVRRQISLLTGKHLQHKTTLRNFVLSMNVYVFACVDITANIPVAEFFTSLIYSTYVYQNIEAKEIHFARQYNYVLRQFIVNENKMCHLQTRNKTYFK
jgi:hypothetical protein